MGSVSRETIVWKALMMAAAAGTGSRARWGSAPWPPTPVTFMSNQAAAPIIACPVVTVWMVPVGIHGATWNPKAAPTPSTAPAGVGEGGEWGAALGGGRVGEQMMGCFISNFGSLGRGGWRHRLLTGFHHQMTTGASLLSRGEEQADGSLQQARPGQQQVRQPWIEARLELPCSLGRQAGRRQQGRQVGRQVGQAGGRAADRRQAGRAGGAGRHVP